MRLDDTLPGAEQCRVGHAVIDDHNDYWGGGGGGVTKKLKTVILQQSMVTNRTHMGAVCQRNVSWPGDLILTYDKVAYRVVYHEH